MAEGYGDPERLDDPASGAEAITPDDATDLATAVRSIYVGGAGDLKVTMYDGSEATFVAVPAGSILPIRVSRVWSTGTTATNLVGIY